jgi:hypothetical protein
MLAGIIFAWRKTKLYAKCRIVAFNSFTSKKLEHVLEVRGYMLWAVYTALGVGVLAGVIATHLDSLIFGA